MDTKLTMSQQCAVAAEKANRLLGCNRQSIAKQVKGGDPLCSELVRYI